MSKWKKLLLEWKTYLIETGRAFRLYLLFEEMICYNNINMMRIIIIIIIIINTMVILIIVIIIIIIIIIIIVNIITNYYYYCYYYFMLEKLGMGKNSPSKPRPKFESKFDENMYDLDNIVVSRFYDLLFMYM
jgi:hypothetical protein